MDKRALEEYYAILTAGARLSGEKSTAQPQHFYSRDVSNNVEFPAEVARKGKALEEARKEKGRKLKKQKQSKHQYTRKLRGG
jgi:hypothetical protein